jgi:uncharacterized protein
VSRLRALPALLLALSLLAGSAAALVDVPYLTGRVVDTAEILSPGVSEEIAQLLRAHEAASGDQVAVLTLPSLDGESVEDFAVRVFQSWKLGQAGRDNGVLVVVAVEDRRLRIEVGYGLEDKLTDLAAGRIIRNAMTPRFRDGDYDGGVEAGVRAIVGILEGTGSVPEEVASSEGEGPSSGFHFEGPDLSIIERILMGAFIFGIIGLFTVIGVVTPGMGWFLYFFLIPFWATFPMVIVGTRGAFVLLLCYLVLFPVTKLSLRRMSWYHRAARDLKKKGTARIGGFTLRSGGSSSSGGSSWSSGGSSFSGGGGSSGGGGASGSW